VFPWTLWLFDGIKIEHQTVVTYMFNITLWGPKSVFTPAPISAENPAPIGEDFLSCSGKRFDLTRAWNLILSAGYQRISRLFSLLLL